METHVHQSGIKEYLFGFISSLFLTLIAYYLVVLHILPFVWRLIAILVCAGLQAIIQLVCFLYLGKEEKPKINLLVFLFMVMILSILIIGTLWIMYSLNERTMPGMNM